MPELELSQGKVAIVDEADYPTLAKYKWTAIHKRNTFYAQRKEHGRTVLMHRVIMGLPPSHVDHIDGDGLNNRRSNLRLASNAQNLANRGKQKNNTSGYKGVHWHKGARKWMAEIMVNKKHIYLGLHATAEDAWLAYAEAAREHFGEFARHK